MNIQNIGAWKCNVNAGEGVFLTLTWNANMSVARRRLQSQGVDLYQGSICES